jgi:hypothetical protein
MSEETCLAPPQACAWHDPLVAEHSSAAGH